MAYFPFFCELSQKPGLVIGGGKVAARKIQKLLPYGPRLTVVSPEILPEIRVLPGVQCLERPFRESDLSGMAFVIAAANDHAVNRRAALLCRDRRIPVNAADDEQLSSFIFPALVKKGPLSIGISTGGSSPAAAIYLKEQIASVLSERLDDILSYLHETRGAVQAAFPSEETRRAVSRALFSSCMEAGRPLTPEEQDALFKAYGGKA